MEEPGRYLQVYPDNWIIFHIPHSSISFPDACSGIILEGTELEEQLLHPTDWLCEPRVGDNLGNSQSHAEPGPSPRCVGA